MSLEMSEGSCTQSHSQTIGPGALELCSPDTLYLGKKSSSDTYVAGTFACYHTTNIKKVIFQRPRHHFQASFPHLTKLILVKAWILFLLLVLLGLSNRD